MRCTSAKKRFMSAWLVAFCLVVAGRAAGEITLYHITDLGTLGGTTGRASALNNQGEVVGWLRTPVQGGDVARAFLWLPKPAYGLPAGFNELDSLVDGGRSYALGINDAGQVVGWSDTQFDSGSGDPVIHAVLWADGAVTNLGSPGGDYVPSWASAINELGQVAGTWNEGLFPSTDSWFLWLPSAAYGLSVGLNDLSPAPGFSIGSVTAMNELGQIVGSWSTDTPSLNYGSIWLPSAAYGLPAGWWALTDFHSIDDINDSGQIIGTRESAGKMRALRWVSGVMTDLGSLDGTDSYAAAINRSGVAVGSASVPGPESHAFRWTNGVMTDLNDLIVPGSGWELRYTYDINDGGQIIGRGRLNNERHSFLLSPFTCGNSVLEEGEECDDGNTDPNDLCDEFCQAQDIPAVSAWGMVILVLSVLTAGTIVLTKRRPVAV